MYEDCIIKGIYKEQDGRDVVHIYFPNGHRKVTSYARYLVEKELNRELNNSETVDHIDRNFNNNSIENLQILNKSEHVSLDNKRIRGTFVRCSWCNKTFYIDGKKIKDRCRKSKNGDKRGLFCSKKCIGMYGAELQNKRTNKIIGIKIEREYYYLDK